MSGGLVPVGLDCQLFYDVASVKTLMPDVIDLMINLELGDAEAKSRFNRFGASAPLLKSLSIDFGYLDRLRTGPDCRLYQNTGSHASPTWTLVGAVRDSTLNCETTQIDVSSRLSLWRRNARGIKTAAADFQLVLDADDSAAKSALRTSLLNRTVIEYGFANGPSGTSGTIIRRFPMIVTKFAESQKLEDGVQFDVSMKLGNATDAPSVLKVGGGSEGTVYGALFAAWLNDTDEVFSLVSSNANIATPGTEYLGFTGAVFKFSEKQPFGDVASADVTVAPVGSSDPAWVTVT